MTWPAKRMPPMSHRRGVWSVLLGGVAVWCIWQARQIPRDDDPAHVAARRRWNLTGFVCAGLAIGLASLASGGDLESR
jgi:hypothetical protein